MVDTSLRDPSNDQSGLVPRQERAEGGGGDGGGGCLLVLIVALFFFGNYSRFSSSGDNQNDSALLLQPVEDALSFLQDKDTGSSRQILENNDRPLDEAELYRRRPNLEASDDEEPEPTPPLSVYPIELPVGKPRFWKDDTGKHSVKASLIRIEVEAVWLRKGDGTEVRVLKQRLSEMDRDIARETFLNYIHSGRVRSE